MGKYLMLAVACGILAGAACLNQQAAPQTPTPYPTPAGPALTVEEYTKACYSAFEETLNDRDRYPTQEQMRQFITELRFLTPPLSLEKFHYAYLAAWETMANEGLLLAHREIAEADAQIGQLDQETHDSFQGRGFCGFDHSIFLRDFR